MNETKMPENNAYKVTLIILVGLAVFSSAMKDLNRLQEMAGSVQDFTTRWRGTDLAMLNVESISAIESCPDSSPLVNSSVESDSIESDAPARVMESVRSDYEAITEPEFGGRVELLASNKANRSVPVTRARYASSRNLTEEISAKARDIHWPARFAFKTFDRTVTLDLPVTIVTDIESDAFEAHASPNLFLSLQGKVSRKQSGKSDNVRREFILKRFERNISSRRAS